MMNSRASHRLRSHLLVATLALAWIAAPGGALADEGAGARADQLFSEGKQRLARGDYASACELLAESHRLDPATGALLALALCHERAGKLASAQREYLEVEARSRNERQIDRERAARARADALAGELSTLRIQLHAGEHDRVQVRLDGAALDGVQLGKPLPVDGGEHTIEAAAPGKQTWRAHVTVAPRADAKSVVVPPLQSELPAPSVAAPAPRPRAPAPAPARPRDSGGWSADEWVGVATIGAGVVGLGLGTMFALRAAGEENRPSKSCTADVCTYTQGGSDAHDAAVLSFVSGGVLAAAGLVIYLASGSSSSSESARCDGPSFAATWTGRRGAGVSLHGRF